MPQARRRIEVLVVDDSREFLRAACSWIDSQPWLALAGTAEDGATAVEQCRRLRPDLVLMDAAMPVMDGFEATRRIKTEAPAPLVVMLSVHDGSAVRHEAWAAGADAFVSKDAFADELVGVIRDLAEGAEKPPEAEPPAASPPEPPAERSGWIESLFLGVRARFHKQVGNDRRPGVVSARSVTEGGLS